ncbi:MAG: hypothetical protein GF308_19730 [Candidatus Heimdallarchaeota archaeon]|nr:hypothetical protein [Candidatus Heimdallarchaeota archaeon]
MNLKKELEEVELYITPENLLVKKFFAGYNYNSYPISGITYVYPLPIINAKAEDKHGRLSTQVNHRTKEQVEVEIDFRKPVFQGKKYSYKLTLLLDDSLIDRIGSIKVLNWPKENITKIWLVGEDLFFSSVLANINEKSNRYEIIPSKGAKSLISHSRKASAIRLEYGNSSIKYLLEHTFILRNTSANSCLDIEAQFHLPPETKYQKTRLIDIPENVTISYDQDKNTLATLSINEMGGFEKRVVKVLLEVTLKKQFIDFETKMGEFKIYRNITREGTFGADLIKPSKFWPTNDSKIIDLVKSAIHGYRETMDIVKLLFEFVNQKISYQRNNARNPADVTIATRVGDCSEYSDLFVTLLRRARIPARIIHGWTFDPETTRLDGHAWVEYFTPNLGWVQCDPTWGFLAGVSCQHICRKREGIGVNLSDSSVKYNTLKDGNLEIETEWHVRNLS